MMEADFAENVRELMQYIIRMDTDFKKLCKFISVFGDDTNAKILYVIYNLRFTTPHEIQQTLNSPSRNFIIYRTNSLMNNDLISIKPSRHTDYQIYMDFWEGHHPTTHGRVPFYTSTDLNDTIMRSVGSQVEKNLSEDCIEHIRKRGEAFVKYYEKHSKAITNDEIQRVQEGLETIGACYQCSKAIMSGADHEFLGNALLCRRCLESIKEAGMMAEIIQESGWSPRKPTNR